MAHSRPHTSRMRLAFSAAHCTSRIRQYIVHGDRIHVADEAITAAPD